MIIFRQMSEQVVQLMIHNLLLALFVLVMLAVVVNFANGIILFRRAVKRQDMDLALAILLGLYAIILAILPVRHPWWNYLGIGWGALMAVFIVKVYFGGIIRQGTAKQKILMLAGIVFLVLIVIFAPYITLPVWMDYIPAV